MHEEAVARCSTFAARRDQAALSPQGPLALVNTQWVSREQTVWAAPGVWSPRPDGAPGLMVTAVASDNVTVDGVLVDGQAVVSPRGEQPASDVRFSETVTATIIAGEAGYALRVFDQESANATAFSHIDRYDYNGDWVLTASWREIPGGSVVGFEHLKDDGHARDEVVPGDIILDFEGEAHTLSAFKAGNALQLVFADATSGVETYSVGRFLFCAPQPDGTITLDFNYAVLPPCAFSYQYNCPLPPANNRLPFAIAAGEKQVMASSGGLLHPD